VSGARSWIVGLLVRRGEFAVARQRLAIEDPVRDVQNRDLTFEAWADLIAAEGTWDEAPPIVAGAREWAEQTGLRFLPFVADRLEGQAALARGHPADAVRWLERARDGFAELEAVWERARTDLALAEAHLAAGDRAQAAVTAQAGAEVFERLSAGTELRAAGDLLARAG
jgi:hypothetical protein